MANVAAGQFTWEDFLDLPEDDLRELIDGELVETEVATYPHERAVMMLGHFLTAWAEAGNGGSAIGSSYKVRVTDRRGVMPDVQFYRSGNIPPKSQHKGLAEGRPDVAVEILSPSGRGYDRVTKVRYYASIGVPEYWLVDPEAKTLERLVLQGGAYFIASTLQGDEEFRPESFPGLAIPLAKLWSI